MVPSGVAISVEVIFGYQAIGLALNHKIRFHHRTLIFIQGKGEKFSKTLNCLEIKGSEVGYVKGRF